MKHCIDCDYYNGRRRSGNGEWRDSCEAPDIIIHHDGPIIKKTKYGECYAERSSGIFGFFAGKCGPEAVLFKQNKKPIPPGPE